MKQPNVLFLMTDQQRFDTIAALGNSEIYTPNLDRLVARGAAFTRAYSTCPVCVPTRTTIRTGCEPTTTGVFYNGAPQPIPSKPDAMEERCGPYLARAMKMRGYRTFGVGKFHAQPADEDLGFDIRLRSEETYATPEERAGDAYAAFIAREHPHFDFVEMLMGERTEMYYQPQMSALPASLGVEAWAADRAIEQIREYSQGDEQPYFGFVSFVGPHPPFAPPLPFNRMYDPDKMRNPRRGEPALDYMDEQIPWMNYLIWAEDIFDAQARTLRARYYGEISYIDSCIGRILDAVEAREDADDTLICFYSDHGEQLGDHGAWQKETFYEESCHVPFLLSWPRALPQNVRRDELVCLTDLFGLATGAAGQTELRDGHDVLGLFEGAAPRENVIGYYGSPGSPQWKIMVREGDWKLIWMANGGREQLFNLAGDPHEMQQQCEYSREVAARLRGVAVDALRAAPSCRAALNESGDDLRAFPFVARPLGRIYQFDASRGVTGFPPHPRDVLGA